ncbi:MAG TPA: endonuclease III, partial [Chloroflexota bacterium]
MDCDDLSDRIQALHQRFEGHYGPAPARPTQDPLAELIQTILSQNTSDLNSDRAYASLRDRYEEDWEAVRTAPIDELTDAIRMGGLPNIKAKRIQAVLEQIAERRSALDL